MKLYADRLITFPPPTLALDEGIVDVSDNVTTERLLEAYSFGIFPWPHEGFPTLWISPERRGVLDFADLHISKSLKKLAAKQPFTFTFNRAFDRVMESCAHVPRHDQSGTWITPRLLTAYRSFHKAGYAHSLEVWDGQALVGGVYGVYVAGVFAGESMFYLRDNASKLGLLKLIEFLSGRGLKWMDIQMVTPLSEQFGGKYISRAQFLRRLDKAKASAKPIEFVI